MATNSVYPAAVDSELAEDAPASVEAKLALLKASNQKLQSKNLELRLRLQQRKSRWGFERQLLAIGGLGLLFVGLRPSDLKASNQKLQSKNLELRLRLQQRKSRWGFERQLLAIGGLGLLFVGLRP